MNQKIATDSARWFQFGLGGLLVLVVIAVALLLFFANVRSERWYLTEKAAPQDVPLEGPNTPLEVQSNP
jgi:hypothetical protein